MKIVKILSLLAILSFASCSTDDDNIESEKNIQSYYTGYMDYEFFAGGSVRIEYDSQNRIIKRIGGLMPIPASVGSVGYNFSPDVTEDIVYNNNEIKITRNIPNVNLFFERKMIVDSKNRIIKKIIYKQAPEVNDSIFYSYNNLNQIEETLRLNGRPENSQIKIYQKAKYHYNQQQNLDSIVTINFEGGSVDTGTEIYRTVEKFSNYDNAANPLKKLIIFDETYLRAISKNNYAKYENLGYKNNELIQQNTSNYNYKYDASGNINFDFVQ